MNNTIIYRPYKSHVWFLFFTIPVAIFAFMATGYCLLYWRFYVLIFAVMGVSSAWLTKALYDSSKTTIFFEPEGLRIACVKYNDCQHVLWEELPYAYYARNFKKHLFLVLSPRSLTTKDIDHFANRGANLSKIVINDVLVIHIDVLQDSSQIKELIRNHVLHVDVY